ncbi:MAG: hypothetical protein JSW27_20190 [Phycisphaerales bacterium]|nr:MAG: hypothetical protein JSW27_20190 [Phycisphaerales bacterium]
MSVAILPMVIVPLSFLFVLLIILIAKAPKVGAWVLGGVILLAPILFLRLGMAGALSRAEAVPLFVVPASFLFVLLIILLAKAPKAAAGVIIVVLVEVLAVVMFLIPSHTDVVQGKVIREIPLPSGGHVTYEQVVKGPGGSVSQKTLPGNVTESVDWQPITPQPAVAAPIWSEGVENEYGADVYPSKRAAARALGLRMDGPIRKVGDGSGLPSKVIFFREELDHDLATAFEEAARGMLAGVPCVIETDIRNLDPKEVGIVLRFVDKEGQNTHTDARGGRLVEARAFADGQPARRIHVRFIEKPWVEDFALFASERPDGQFVVARSRGTCISENEAKNQALRDACAQVSAAVGQKWPGRALLTVSPTDLLEGGFILDQFVQSFDGMSGQFWRQAMLIDMSAQKLSRLESRKTAEMHIKRITWARMILSGLGVLVIIVAVYLFLNMATRGYYVWSLRIAGTVLAIAGIVSIILVLR